jgi:hypothetical protein
VHSKVLDGQVVLLDHQAAPLSTYLTKRRGPATLTEVSHIQSWAPVHHRHG